MLMQLVAANHLALTILTVALGCAVLGLVLMLRGRAQAGTTIVAAGHDQYRSMVETLDDAVVRCDLSGRVTYANPAAARLLGQPDLEGSVFLLGGAGAIKTDDPALHRFDTEMDGGAGPIWISWTEQVVRGPGGAELQFVGRDVTKQRLAATELAEAHLKLEAANQAKSRFLATVSHEMRTPLNGVLGMTGLLMDTSVDPEQRAYLQAIQTSGESLLSLIDGILDFSKIEAGKIDIVKSEFNLRELVEGTVELLAPRAQGKGLEIASSIGFDLPERVEGDAARIRQVLVNLAGNAVKFTEEGGVLVEVDRDEAGHLRFRVEDTGPGIAADRLEAIFEEFEQGEGPATSRHEGSGLGLAISRRLVESMGGTLAAASEPGRGSVFTAALPIACPASGHPSWPAGIASGRVLLIGRGPFELDALARMLRAVGLETQRAADAAYAMELLRMPQPFDIAVIDLAQGDEAARLIAARARAAGVKRIFVLLSPFERRSIGSPIEAGYDGWLVKPVRRRSLLAHLLPGGDQARAAPQPAPRSTKTGAAQLSGPPVLLAEDNPINALLTRRQLERLGIPTVWAKDGLEALQLIEAMWAGQHEPFRGALFDLRMPGLDGRSLTRRVRQFERQAQMRHLPIVALTASAFPEERVDGIEAGFDDFLIKPVDPAQLAEIIGRWPGEAAQSGSSSRAAG